MCNRVVQKGRGEVRPGQRAKVLMKGPGAYFEIESEGVFNGCARVEKTNYWIKREGAEPVLVPEVERFGEKHQITWQQSYEDVPPGTALKGLLLPPPGKDYRLLKIVTQDATPEQFARWGNDRAPVLLQPG
jgi:hypothetical protein